jgi:hypothetical protein
MQFLVEQPMSGKQAVTMIGIVALVWHLASLLQDAERCKRNLDRFIASPNGPNLLRLALAEGALIGDLRWI